MKPFLGCGAFATAVLVVAVAFFVWVGHAWIELDRADVSVEAVWARKENALLHRQQTASELLSLARSVRGTDRVAIEALADALARAKRFVVSPALLDDPVEYDAFSTAQAELAAGIDRLVSASEGRLRQASAGAYVRLVHEIDVATSRLDVAESQLLTAVERYNERLADLPHRLVAGWAGLVPRTMPGSCAPEPGTEPPSSARTADL